MLKPMRIDATRKLMLPLSNAIRKLMLMISNVTRKSMSTLGYAVRNLDSWLQKYPIFLSILNRFSLIWMAWTDEIYIEYNYTVIRTQVLLWPALMVRMCYMASTSSQISSKQSFTLYASIVVTSSLILRIVHILSFSFLLFALLPICTIGHEFPFYLFSLAIVVANPQKTISSLIVLFKTNVANFS